MEFVNLGKTGLKVSRAVPGMHDLRRTGARPHPWTLERGKEPAVHPASVGGAQCFDTANSYSDGTSEEIVGRALQRLRPARRDRDRHEGSTAERRPNGSGLSRKAIMREIDASLQRLGTDYVDLYQIHRWDYRRRSRRRWTPARFVKAGKVRYIGASSMYAWQFAKAVCTRPTSRTTSSGASSARRPITPRMFSSTRKCWPSDFFGAGPLRRRRSQHGCVAVDLLLELPGPRCAPGRAPRACT